ncbi:MAG: hypothetical protein JW913_20560 [Chitinispirillaceae bacterium]|nr:hypothetical protein [Chitinispirillaceae bacterium]
MTKGVSLCGTVFGIDIPPEYLTALLPLFDPFNVVSGNREGAMFTVASTGRPFDPEGASPRGDVFYRDNGPERFSLFGPLFELSVSLDTRSGTLHIREPVAGNAGALIFNAFKWFVTYIALGEGGLPLHSSLIRREDGCGLLFCGPSGRGKTTIRRFLSSAHPDWRCGSDELNIVYPSADAITVSPTPFVSHGGACGFSEATAVHSISFLKHDRYHHVEPLSSREVYFQLLKNTYLIPGNNFLAERMFDTITCLSKYTFFISLYFSNDASIAAYLERQREQMYEVSA